jgi:hypothetical protein
MEMLLCYAANLVNRAIDATRVFIAEDLIVLSSVATTTEYSPSTPAYVEDCLTQDMPECYTPEHLMKRPLMHDMDAFITPPAPTVPVLPTAPMVVTHTVSFSGGNQRSRRNLAMQFARCAPPTAGGLKRRRQEEKIVRSVRAKNLPEALSTCIIRSDLLDSEEEEQ